MRSSARQPVQGVANPRKQATDRLLDMKATISSADEKCREVLLFESRDGVCHVEHHVTQVVLAEFAFLTHSCKQNRACANLPAVDGREEQSARGHHLS